MTIITIIVFYFKVKYTSIISRRTQSTRLKIFISRHTRSNYYLPKSSVDMFPVGVFD